MASQPKTSARSKIMSPIDVIDCIADFPPVHRVLPCRTAQHLRTAWDDDERDLTAFAYITEMLENMLAFRWLYNDSEDGGILFWDRVKANTDWCRSQHQVKPTDLRLLTETLVRSFRHTPRAGRDMADYHDARLTMRRLRSWALWCGDPQSSYPAVIRRDARALDPATPFRQATSGSSAKADCSSNGAGASIDLSSSSSLTGLEMAPYKPGGVAKMLRKMSLMALRKQRLKQWAKYARGNIQDKQDVKMGHADEKHEG